MKKLFSLVLLMSAMMSVSAFAQSRDARNNGGSLTLRDGRSIIRIDIGDDRDDREMLMRVRRLEQAVRDLQDQVYQLAVTPRIQIVHTCSGSMFSIGQVSGSGQSKTEAVVSAMADCQRKNGGRESMFCKKAELTCFTREERI
jgi:TolA-binding protein